MLRYRLVAKVDRCPGPSFLVRSPAVGVTDGVPARGVYLNPSDELVAKSYSEARLAEMGDARNTERFINRKSVVISQ